MSEEQILDRIAYAMMTVQINRAPHRTLDQFLVRQSEVQRTYKRLLSSGEAKAMLHELRSVGFSLDLVPVENGDPK